MFGPDKCGEDYKLHFIFRHKNPKTGEYEEKHAKKPDSDLRTYYTDKKTHLYTLGKIYSCLDPAISCVMKNETRLLHITTGMGKVHYLVKLCAKVLN